MPKPTTFVLGAGFSVEQGFPLLRGLTERVVHYLEAELHPSYETFLRPDDLFPAGQFYAGLKSIDPGNVLGFEELLIALRKRLADAHSTDACFTTDRVLRIGAARLLWCFTFFGRPVDRCYSEFAELLVESEGAWRVVSFNWDVLVEQSLSQVGARWKYSLAEQTQAVPVIKPHGSINWTALAQHPNLSSAYQGWRPIGPGSTLSFDATRSLEHPDAYEIHSDLRLCIYPGDPDAPETHRDLGLLWQDVGKAIDASEEVVFIGYSLPPYDSFAHDALVKVCRQKAIRVYDPGAETLARFNVAFPKATLAKMAFNSTPFASRPTA